MPPAPARVFVALPIEPAPAVALERWAAAALPPGAVRLVAAPNLHVTTTFCGALPAERVALAIAIVVGVTPPGLRWRLEPAGLRILGSAVAAVYAPDDAASTLQRRIEQRLVEEGLAREEGRPWLPHVTVARTRRRGLDLGDAQGPDQPLAGSRIGVFASVQSAHGTEYVLLAAAP